MTTVPHGRRGRTSSPAREPTAAGLYRRWHTPRQRRRHSTGRAGAWHAEKNSATPKTSGRAPSARRAALRPQIPEPAIQIREVPRGPHAFAVAAAAVGVAVDDQTLVGI